MLAGRGNADVRWTRTWAQGFWALVDQAIVSLGSAATGVLLARSLPSREFGTVVLILAAMLFLNAVHASLIVYPLSVFGARLEVDEFGPYFGRSLGSALIIAAPLCLLLGGVARAFDSSVTAVWAMLALLTWQLQETIRRALFSRLRHRDAVTGDVLSYIGQAAVVGILGIVSHLSLPLVLGVMAATSFIGGLAQLMVLPMGRVSLRGSAQQALSGLIAGRWTLPSNLFGAFIMQLPVWSVALVVARSAAGEFQALVTVVGVMNPVMFGVANLLVPAIAKANNATTRAFPRRLLTSSASQGGLLLLPYALILLIWPGQILGLVYGHTSAYANQTLPLQLLTCAYLLVYLAHIGNAALFGFERPRDVLNVQLAGAGTLALVGIPAMASWGVSGAAVAVIVAHTARVVVCARGLTHVARATELRSIVVVGSG